MKVDGHGKLAVANKEAEILKEGLEGFASGVYIRKIDLLDFYWKKVLENPKSGKIS